MEIAGEPRTVYRQVIDMNARGQVTGEHRGIDNQLPGPEPSVSVSFGFDAATGRLETIDGINAQGLDVQDVDYDWDELGNLISREERSGSEDLSETFGYDGLNRLTSQQVAGQSAITVGYDAIGNILTKTGVGTYTHGAGSAGPHAVTAAGGTSYSYDGNGNNTSGDGRTITYTTFDLPSQISDGHVTGFAYRPDRSRYRRIDTGTAGTTTTRYVGSVEIIFKPNGDQDRKRYIAGVAVETVHFGDNAIEDYRELHYLHKDHLGSLDAITDDQGALLQDLAFDAWGERRNPDTWGPYTEPQLIAFDHSATTRGFTGHEMLDEVGIIHMNGRIYDPKLGRFLQADPFVQEPTNTQSPNRYSYVFNNPLAYTDPSGYSAWTDFRDSILRPIAAIAIAVILPQALPSLGSVFGVAATTTAAAQPALLAFAAAGFVSGGVASGNLRGAAIGAFGGFAFGAIGAATSLSTEAAIFAHGMTGGIMAELQGGKFGHGFISAGITKGFSPMIARIQSSFVGTIVAAVVGGTVSEITGGKFSNGATTAAFGYAFNQLQQATGPVYTTNQTNGQNGTTIVERVDANGKIVGSLTLDVGVTLRDQLFTEQLLDLSQYAGGANIDVTSGYRSQQTQNALVRSGNPRAATISQHTVGSAADFRITGLSAQQAAMVAFNSGIFNRVNLYTTSSTIHVDQMANVSAYFAIDWVRQPNP